MWDNVRYALHSWTETGSLCYGVGGRYLLCLRGERTNQSRLWSYEGGPGAKTQRFRERPKRLKIGNEEMGSLRKVIGFLSNEPFKQCLEGTLIHI